MFGSEGVYRSALRFYEKKKLDLAFLALVRRVLVLMCAYLMMEGQVLARTLMYKK